jgi:hypothetical protein
LATLVDLDVGKLEMFLGHGTVLSEANRSLPPISGKLEAALAKPKI